MLLKLKNAWIFRYIFRSQIENYFLAWTLICLFPFRNPLINWMIQVFPISAEAVNTSDICMPDPPLYIFIILFCILLSIWEMCVRYPTCHNDRLSQWSQLRCHHLWRHCPDAWWLSYDCSLIISLSLTSCNVSLCYHVMTLSHGNVAVEELNCCTVNNDFASNGSWPCRDGNSR